jgi:hypothetical protein
MGAAAAPVARGRESAGQLSKPAASLAVMLTAILLAVAGVIVAAILAAVLKRPREWMLRTLQRVWRAMSLRRHEDTERAVDRIAAELAARRCSQEGNPDDEYYSDWYRWFTGDPEANVDYSRKQEHDLARLRRGDYGRS